MNDAAQRFDSPVLAIAGTWEKLQAMLDSGATIFVIPRHVGREYPVVPGEAVLVWSQI